jgi:hypothetical protein
MRDAVDLLMNVAEAAGSTASDPLKAESLLSSFVGREGALDELLERGLEGELRGRAVWHPNGFMKVRLRLPKDRGAVRFHQWKTSERPEDVHNHRWNFVSHVLRGELMSQAFEVVDGREYEKYRCRSSPGGYSLDQIGTCSIRRSGGQVYAMGDTYFQSHDAFHLARPVVPSTLSMIVCGEPVFSSSTVLRSAPRVAAPVVAAAGDDEYRRVLRKIQGLIHEQG